MLTWERESFLLGAPMLFLTEVLHVHPHHVTPHPHPQPLVTVTSPCHHLLAKSWANLGLQFSLKPQWKESFPFLATVGYQPSIPVYSCLSWFTAVCPASHPGGELLCLPAAGLTSRSVVPGFTITASSVKYCCHCFSSCFLNLTLFWNNFTEVQFTDHTVHPFKCTVQWFWVYSELCKH